MTTKTRARTAHFPKRIAPSAMGARTSAVAVRHQSITLPSLNPAPTTGTGREGLYGAQKLLGREIGPQGVRHVELGVGYLPEQEVRDPQFPAGADHQVNLGHLGRVEVAREGRLVDLLGGETVGDYAPGRVHDLRAAAVVERDVDVEVVVGRGQVLCLLHGIEHSVGEMLAASEEAQAGAAVVLGGALC